MPATSWLLRRAGAVFALARVGQVPTRARAPPSAPRSNPRNTNGPYRRALDRRQLLSGELIVALDHIGLPKVLAHLRVVGVELNRLEPWSAPISLSREHALTGGCSRSQRIREGGGFVDARMVLISDGVRKMETNISASTVLRTISRCQRPNANQFCWYMPGFEKINADKS
jgi:hypothetical protein